MDFVSGFVETIDYFLIAPYRWSGNPVIGWWTGTTILAVWAALLGKLTIALVFRVNRSHIKETVGEMAQRHSQSMNALKAGDRTAYKAINKLANEAFGKSFFLQVAMASASLWPIPCALAWLQIRFSSIRFSLPFDIPLIGNSVGYSFIFIPIYILARILLGKIKIRKAHNP
ncbi:MAG: hypothetical protein ISR61_09585 [Desulfobacteraceae bacterium]|uniref:DUF106 domain-containing protein n=1 Tax=Candidatus Desulfacyla euxinica TaxID=2841693 RepID=A0A8J6MYV0_9DELT|nr:hypothetical protein [Candidatus Desulfacyla euxinica]MBL6979190.1 hypothetical protein [Desulfobacteraceae bacterium]MBL7216923.1 hypothetical protein [Desulfobacteraceae bacterium]